jgi:type IV pilus assembly protein PilA
MVNRRAATAAFSLIEMLVVLMIIGILIAVLYPSLQAYRARPYDAAAIACGRAIVTGEVDAHASTGEYVAGLSNLGGDVPAACDEPGVRVVLHNSAPNASTAATGAVQAEGEDFAFTVFHPRGTGFYRYWHASPDPTGNGNRLNRKFSWGP